MIRVTRKQDGFTLIELMVVVAIIAIIAGIAVSTFRGVGQDTQRARAQADLAALNDALSRYYQSGYTYTGATVAALQTAAGISPTDKYTFSISIPTDGQSYSLRAQPATGMGQTGDGALAINNIGRRCYFPGTDAPGDWTLCPKSF